MCPRKMPGSEAGLKATVPASEFWQFPEFGSFRSSAPSEFGSLAVSEFVSLGVRQFRSSAVSELGSLVIRTSRFRRPEPSGSLRLISHVVREERRVEHGAERSRRLAAPLGL